ncbi:MAG: Metal-dependent phosphohydrolase, HD subdomain [uncultured Cytophagales bacterium]|uniref:Metal-dependent phosphohydrolase, HD subdomain n=1 Tax=uncultured Cytophagales bacterium TaxID=158755 RepID=A0A6J4HKP4_9SPHI|nr:MAG: Metal-dependent phosphohydrolase, HD subdomain [uncultured Cytophagales bacterium]
MAPETDLLARTHAYAESILTERLASTFLFHNVDHTREVVEAVKEIGRHSALSDKDLETLLIAAWLHDVGYRDGRMNHERTSMQIARTFLEEQGVGEKRIEKVLQCIAATEMPQRPQNALAEIMCDADLHHLATDGYAEKSELLRQEISLLTGEKVSKRKWLQGNKLFYEKHHYFTEYGRTVLEPRKQANLQRIEAAIAEREAGKAAEKEAVKAREQEKQALKTEAKAGKEKEGKEAKKEKEKRPERGVETMFRLTSQNHVELSAMADNKANIMITVNSIIVSILVSILIRKFEEFPNLVVPTIILTLVCLVTIVFAVLATRPNVSSGTFTREDILAKRTNLLFFGNFHNVSLQDYEAGVREMMNDSEFLYGSMTRDIYYQGKVLGRKYRLLRISYTVFMFGFVLAVLSFGIAIFFFPVVD